MANVGAIDMKITELNTENDGTRNFEIRVGEISFRALIRYLRKMSGVMVSDTAFDPMNDNAKGIIEYKDVKFEIETPFSDFILSCRSESLAVDEFVNKLRNMHVRWWDKLA